MFTATVTDRAGSSATATLDVVVNVTSGQVSPSPEITGPLVPPSGVEPFKTYETLFSRVEAQYQDHGVGTTGGQVYLNHYYDRTLLWYCLSIRRNNDAEYMRRFVESGRAFTEIYSSAAKQPYQIHPHGMELMVKLHSHQPTLKCLVASYNWYQSESQISSPNGWLTPQMIGNPDERQYGAPEGRTVGRILMTFLTMFRVHSGTQSKPKALKLLDLTLHNIEPNGAFRCWAARDKVTGEYGQVNFHNMIFCDALLDCFETLGEQRAFDGASRMLDYIWAQWKGKGFQYCDRNTVQGDTAEAPDLNGLAAKPFARRYAITRDPLHRQQALTVLNAIQYTWFNIKADKQTNQALAHSQCVEGYLSS